MAPHKLRGAGVASVQETIARDDQSETGDPLVALLKQHAQAAGPGVALSLGFQLLVLTVQPLTRIQTKEAVYT